MFLFKLMALAITLLGVFGLAWKKPHYMVYFIAGSVAFEISRTWYPAFGPGSELGTVTLVRIATIGIYCCALYRIFTDANARQRLNQLARNPLTWALGAYVLIGLLSFFYSVTKAKTLVETVRLCSLIALFVAVGLLAKPGRTKNLFHVVHWVGVALFPLALYQRITGTAFWLPVEFVEHIRANVTFVDPNIYARFLVLAVIANLVLQLIDQSRPRIVYYASMVLLLAQIVLSMSRSGLLTLAVVIALFLVLVPERKVLFPVGFLIAGGLILLLLEPQLLRRFQETVSSGLTSYDAVRAGLWKGAIAMFKDHPVLGIGLGGFERAYLNEYAYTRLVDGGASLSHTTLLTIAAELGIVGLLGVIMVGLAVGWNYLQIRRISREARVLGAGLLLWIATVFIHSQFEARMFEDPILWVSMASMILMVKIPTFGTKY